MFDDTGEGLDPISAVQVVDSADELIGGGVDVAANDAAAILLLSQALQLRLIAAGITDRLLDACLDHFAEGKVFLSEPATGPVVKAVDSQKGVIADRAEDSQPAVIGGDAVKAIAMDDEVVTMWRLVDVLVHDLKAAQFQRDEPVEQVVVIAPEINDFGILLFEFSHDQSDEPGMSPGPIPPLPSQMPGIDDIAVKDELFRTGFASENRSPGRSCNPACPDAHQREKLS